MKPKKLYIIDFMAMAFRNFHAFSRNPLTTSNGFPTSSIFGSSQFLLKLLKEEKPDYILAACDTPDKNFRHAMYEAYKANRSEMPEDLSKQLPPLFRLLECLNIKLYRSPGFEADDIIGSICSQWANDELQIYIVSGDKDFMQLINDNVKLYAPKKAGKIEIIDDKGVEDYFGVLPHKVIDVLALMGDSVDNVPGVAGIGAKGAAKLLNKFESLEDLYSNLDSLPKNKQKENLVASKDMAFLSKELVTIKKDMELEVELKDLAISPEASMANDELHTFFKDMEFNALVQKTAALIEKQKAPAEDATGSFTPRKIEDTFISGEPKPAATSQNSTKQNTDAKSADEETPKSKFHTKFEICQTPESIEKLLKELASVPIVAFDTETTGLDIVTDRPIGISFSTEQGSGFYIPLDAKHLKDTSVEQVISWVKDFFESSPKQQRIAHNLKFDLQMLWNLGIEPVGEFEDTMLQAFIIDSSKMRYGIDSLSAEYLGLEKIKTSDLIGKKGQISMLDVDLDTLAEYACEDTDCCLRLFLLFDPMLTNRNLQSVYKELERPLLPILAAMERRGIFVNAGELDQISSELAVKIEALQKEITELAGEEFNINSTKQLREVIFEKLKIHEKLGITKIKKNKSGYSTDVSVLEKLSGHRLPAAILEYRSFAKLKNTYVDTLPQLIHPETNRIHTSFHQTGTATGRLSSSGPNLQNIPIRSSQGKEIRKAFQAEESDHVIISADYSQVELRMLAHMSGDENLIESFKSGEDIHTATAAKMFHKSAAEVTPLDRSNAKAINFGIMYGMGPRRLSQQTGVSLSEAKEFIEAYFGGFPKVKGFLDTIVDKAREAGYSETISGRRRPISGLDDSNGMTRSAAENMAKNSPIQGSAADLIKAAMIKLTDNLASSTLRAKLLLQVHDELVLECPRNEVEDLYPILRSSMEEALSLTVPLKVEMGEGNNWLEAH